MDFVRTIGSDDEADDVCSEGSLDMPADGFLADLGESVEQEVHHLKEWDFQADGQLEEQAQTTTLEEKIKRRREEKEQYGYANEPDSNDDILEKTHEKKRRRPPETSVDKATKKFKAPAPATHLKTKTHFSDLHLSKPLLKALQDLGFDTATPIQRDTIPHALAGSDVLGTAETGSGKTGAFLLPTLERIHSSPSLRGRYRAPDGRVITGKVSTKALILLPTRELAAQCYSMMSDLMKYTCITGSLVCGGYQSQAQATNLRSQPDVVICTPGRILDHLLNSQNVHLELLEIVILDEADRLLELGFRDECKQIIKRCSKGRQTMLFSATLNADVQDLASLALQKPIRVTANAPNKVVKTLHQEFIRINSDEWRGATLLALIRRREEDCDKTAAESLTIVFFAMKKDAHWMATILGLAGIRCTELHGNLSQTQRIEGVTKFQKGEVQLLLATDLASRGLDLHGVGTVINYEVPTETPKYIHRVGRTARMGQEGDAITLYTDEEYNQVKKLGKLCSTEMKAEIVKRTVAQDVVDKAWQDINGWSDDVAAIMDDESLERELRLADVQSKKASNMVAHKTEIYSRPQKLWPMSQKEKADIQEQEKQEKAEAQPLPGESEDDFKTRLRTEKRVRQKKMELKQVRVEHDKKMVTLARKAKKKMKEKDAAGIVPVKKKNKKKKFFGKSENKNKENQLQSASKAPGKSSGGFASKKKSKKRK
eukprot:GEMP01026764.1.p1 GENE.GEMP01026764.1~~GEMP01026764.1.p1  ORF type:complete len:720 (+),score=164.67 GEMP01026764.1:24-2162(+)